MSEVQPTTLPPSAEGDTLTGEQDPLRLVKFFVRLGLDSSRNLANRANVEEGDEPPLYD
jgi:hypothetical protein